MNLTYLCSDYLLRWLVNKHQVLYTYWCWMDFFASLFMVVAQRIHRELHKCICLRSDEWWPEQTDSSLISGHCNHGIEITRVGSLLCAVISIINVNYVWLKNCLHDVISFVLKLYYCEIMRFLWKKLFFVLVAST